MPKQLMTQKNIQTQMSNEEKYNIQTIKDGYRRLNCIRKIKVNLGFGNPHILSKCSTNTKLKLQLAISILKKTDSRYFLSYV